MTRNSLDYFLGRMLDRVSTEIPMFNIYNTQSTYMTITDDGYHYEYPIPGVAKTDVQLKLDGYDMMVIANKTTNENRKSSASYKYSSTIPQDADLNSIFAKVENGMLYIDIKVKSEEDDTTVKTIEIN